MLGDIISIGALNVEPYKWCLKHVVIDYNVVIHYKSKMKDIAYSRDAIKTLRRMPKNTSKRIKSKIEAHAKNPASQANNITALQGLDGVVRLRIGDWRVIIEDGAVLAVIKIASRGNVY